MSIWSEQFSSKYDFSEAPFVSRRYVICSTPRCGSHLLGHLLYSTGSFGYPLEYFNPANLPRWLKRAKQEGHESLVSFLMKKRTSHNGCFGLKAHFIHLEYLEKYVDLQQLASEYRFIFIRRRDLISQAVSYAKAIQTGAWISEMSSDKTAHYDSSLIGKCLNAILWQNAGWLNFFHSLGIDYLPVSYEYLRANPEKIVQDIAEFIEVTINRKPRSKNGRLQVQATSQNTEWKKRYIKDMRNNHLFFEDFCVMPGGGNKALEIVKKMYRNLKSAK